MASPNSTFTEMVSTTLRHHKREVADNLSNHNALWRKMHAKGNLMVVSGGYEIVCPLDYDGSNNYQRYSGYETLNIQATETITAAKFDWKQAAVHVTASGRELRMNRSREAMINLAKQRTVSALKQFRNNLTQDCYSAGTADGGKQIGGLQALITTDGTGTIGGINASTYTWWKNQFQDNASATGTGVRDNMQTLWLATCRGDDKTDCIISSTELYQEYWSSLTDLQRFAQANTGTSGFQELKFVDADVIHDTSDSGIPANRQYHLNTDYLRLVVHPDANLTELDDKVSVNQDAVVMPFIFQGNLTVSNRARQGLLFD